MSLGFWFAAIAEAVVIAIAALLLYLNIILKKSVNILYGRVGMVKPDYMLELT